MKDGFDYGRVCFIVSIDVFYSFGNGSCGNVDKYLSWCGYSEIYY